jgi:NADPH:quinone reductase-like Zn-dependent oxidoreductase
MRAVVRDRYGDHGVLHLEELPTPTPGPGEVRLRVRATSLNASDLEFLRGSPAYIRLWGLTRPAHRVLGSDVAGEVEAVGEGVDAFAVGDRVFGDLLYTFGGLAERAVAKAGDLRALPQGLSFVEAAALPQSGCIAVRGVGEVAAGARVLINGAGGGGGTLAVQLAKHRGAHVTAVDAGPKLEALRELGADAVIDFRDRDFAAGEDRWDHILDLVARRPMHAVHRALAPGGRYRLVGGRMREIVGVLTVGTWLTWTTSETVELLGIDPLDGIDELLALVAAGHLRPVVDRVVPLEDAVEAVRRLLRGEALGKLVVTP